MRAVQPVIRWCGALALVVSVVALWRVESHATTPTAAPTTALRAPTAPPVEIAPSPVAVVAAAPVVVAAPVVPAPVRANNPDPRGLRVRRLVLTRAVHDHEPIDPGDTFRLADGGRILAFVELDNASGDPAQVVIRFEHDGAGAAAGSVALDVPAQRHWRTWGFSHGVRRAGAWTAVVSTVSGRELARADFQVTT